MVPAVQRVHRVPRDCWRILPDGLYSLFAGFAQRSPYVYGNALSSIAALCGMAAEELTPQELDAIDTRYPVANCIHCRK